MHLCRIYAESPAFVRHEIHDPDNPDDDIKYRNEYPKDPNDPWENVSSDFYEDSDISYDAINVDSVSYLSDGKTLNVTFWFSAPFDSTPNMYIPTYAMYIDVDSNSKTGSRHGPGGADYSVKLTWNNATNKWEKLFGEESATVVGAEYTTGSYRLLNKTDNYTNFFEAGNNYIKLPLDLNAISSPGQYLVTFEAEYKNMSKWYNYPIGNSLGIIKDVFPWISIPETKFNVTLSPSTLTIKPHENKTVEIRISSNVNLDSTSILSTEKNRTDVQLLIDPTRINIAPNGAGTSYFYIYAFDNVSSHTATIPIYQSLSFHSEHINYENATTATSYLTVLVQDYPFSERWIDMWNTYGGLISLIGGGFVGGFAGFIFAKMESKKKSAKMESKKKSEGAEDRDK
jgi:hypothetical protein